MFPPHIIRAALPGLAIALGVIFAAIALAVCADRASARTLTCTDAPHRFEDDPCWNWVTDGNGFRGVVTMHGTFRVVSADRFARLYEAGNLDRYPFNQQAPRTGKRSGCMRGDATALGLPELPHTGYYSCAAVNRGVLRH